MCGSYNSVLGCEINSVVSKIVLHNEDIRFKLLDEDDSVFNAVVIKFDDLSFKAVSITPINKIIKMGE
jgi:calcineurin-like phosphoesterase